MNELLEIDPKEFDLTQERINDLIKPFVPLSYDYMELIPQVENIKKEFKEK
jgi:hypothetical protein